MKKDAVISIIIPIYNLEKYLDRCLKSVKNQQFKAFECLLIDDGSVDRSEDICKKYVRSDCRFQYHKKTNGGVSSARNMGLDLCSGTYICFVDGDDIMEEEALRVLYDFMVAHKLDYIQGGFTHEEQLVSNKGTGELQIFLENQIYDEVMPSNGIFMPCVSGALYKRELIENLSFDISYQYGEDFLFLVRYLKNCRRIGHLSKIVYHYVLNDDSATQSTEKNSLKKVSDTLESLEAALELCTNLKHYYLLEARVFNGIENWLFYQLVKRRLCNKNDEITKYLVNKLRDGSKNYRKNPFIIGWKRCCLISDMISPFLLAMSMVIEKAILKMWRQKT